MAIIRRYLIRSRIVCSIDIRGDGCTSDYCQLPVNSEDIRGDEQIKIVIRSRVNREI